MVKEADLECCAYFHLRKYLHSDSSWKILARKHTPTKHYIDLLLFRKEKPRIALELKWNKQSIGKKDKRSLSRSVKQLAVHRAYFISTVTRGKGSFQQEPYAEIILPYNVKGIYIPLGKQDGWHKRRRKFMSEMTKGKAKHKNKSKKKKL
jgi:hypothetical protein